MPRVLLTGKDWATRALLRAQLLEEKVQVEAYETAGEALDGVTDLSDLPDLWVADLGASLKPEAELALLVRWAALVPVWIIVASAIPMRCKLDEAPIERILARPLDVGQLTAEIKQRAGG